jgi:cystathionine beta-lyase/cystathionine gamma-synthase
MTHTYAFDTLAVHAGQEPDPATGAVMTPIYQSATFRQERIGRHQGYEYSRTGNPTRKALEDCLAALEDGKQGLAFASGMAAIDAALHLLQPGDHILAVDDLYGGTYRIFERVYAPLGIRVSYAPAVDPAHFLEALEGRTRLVWLESPTNPLLNLCDIPAISDGAHRSPSRPWVCVDNTFASPYLQQPLALGADLALHSTTKYLGGHSDIVGGAIVVRDAELGERLSFLQNAVGAVPSPMDCFLALRGIKTLALRMERHAHNAQAIAEFLSARPEVARVYYPGLATHPQGALARRQMRNAGGMVSFTLKAGPDAARALAEATRLFTLAESLGGVESLIEVPAAMTHASAAGSPLQVDPSLVRLSVGIEAAEDLIADLRSALEVHG